MDSLTLIWCHAKESMRKPEAHRPQLSPECTAMKAIFSKSTVNVACKKINLSFAMATNQIQQFSIWLLEDYSRNITVKLSSNCLKSDRNIGLLSLFLL